MRRPNEAEFTDFAQRAVGDLRRTAYLVCGDWQQAEDAAQETLLKMYRHWHRIDPAGRFAYGRTTVVRSTIDAGRRPWRRERAAEDLPELPGPDIPSQGDTRDAVMRALATLTPRRRACLVLRYYQELSVAETAAALGCSQGTVKSQTSDALKALRPLLSPDFVMDRSTS